MTNRILVTYATATGATTDVAATIAETLRECNFAVDVEPISDSPSLGEYQAVVIGSAVLNRSWLPEAIDFVKSNQQALSQLPVALFTVHVQNLDQDDQSKENRHAYLDAVRPFIHPIDEAFFAGRMNRHIAKRFIPRIIAFFVPSMDYRDWDHIRAWADAMATQIQHRVA